MTEPGESIGALYTDSSCRRILLGPADRLSRTHHGAFGYSRHQGREHVGLDDLQIGRARSSPRRMCGNLPRIDQPKYVTSIPKYLGHIPKKSPNNTFATRWRPGNQISYSRLGKTGETKAERALSSPAALTSQKSMKIIPRVPGLMTHQPGVEAENVYALKFGIANKKAQELRERNPYISSKWTCRDPRLTLRLQRLIPGSQMRADLQDQYLPEENQYASLCAMETKLLPVSIGAMSWTKYCTSSAKGLSYDPGNVKAINPLNMRAAGQRAYYGTEQLEAQRWQHHMWFSRDAACGSISRGAMIEPH